MRSFHITAVDVKGKTIEDIVSAESTQELTQIVKGRNLFLLEYKEGTAASDSITKLKIKPNTQELGFLMS